MSRKKVSTTIYITPEQADRLKLLHERTKVPIAVFIREGIDMMLKHYEHVLPGQMSLEAAPSLSPTPPPVALPVTSQAPREAPLGSRREPPTTTLRTGYDGPRAAAEGGGGRPAADVGARPQAASGGSRSGDDD
jgi:hypothetical protein